MPDSRAELSGYLDASATTPPAAEVLAAMAEASAEAWANPSSLHAAGVRAAERLERSRWILAEGLGCAAEELVLCSGGSEAIHMALLGWAADRDPGRILLSAVEHPATLAAADRLQRMGWQVARVPVDRRGRLDLPSLRALLRPPTRLMSLIWGQNEVGTVQPLVEVGKLCRAAGVVLHVDAVQLVGHRRLRFDALPVDLLSCAAHKLQGPRGIGALLVRQGVRLAPLIGGAQEGGRRGGTEPVVLAAGFAAALELAVARLGGHGGEDPIACVRDRLWRDLRQRPWIHLTGGDPAEPLSRLPHHLSVLVTDPEDRALSGRALVRALDRESFAVSSGSACSSTTGTAASPVLLAMGYDERESAGGLRISIGPWVDARRLAEFPAALERARRWVMASGQAG
jgi:cysteine desulfurase